MTAPLDTEKKLALLGAYDRFNYGDLLFPIVAINELTAHGRGIRTLVHALARSDLSRYGALPTGAVGPLYRRGTLAEGDVVLFVGGGTVGVDWGYMHANLLGSTGNWILYRLKRLFGEAIVNSAIRLAYGSRSTFPWVARPDDFPVPVKVAYNAIGGSELARLPARAQAQILDALSQASYLSVRDAETKRLLAAVEASVPVVLAPDSAMLMSAQFPVDWLATQAGESTRQLLEPSPYVCFQANLPYVLRNRSRIVPVLEAIFEGHGLRAVLLPIGRYVGLDDQVALRELRESLRTPVEMVSSEASIWEIMLTIARSSLFVGTSLHGAITSQSFGVPHLALSERPCKLDHYVETWEIAEQSRCVPLEEVGARAGRVLAVAQADREKRRDELVVKVHENFARLAEACGIDWAET